jgi:hypothetical protein
MIGGDAGPDLADQHIEALGGELAGLAHALEGGSAVNLDLAGLTQRRAGRIDIGHGGCGINRKPLTAM